MEVLCMILMGVSAIMSREQNDVQLEAPIVLFNVIVHVCLKEEKCIMMQNQVYFIRKGTQ